MEKLTETPANIMKERFGKDNIIALATVGDGEPYVRYVNSYYEEGAFYIITYALSNKMRQIAKNSTVALCGEWFTGHGRAQKLGWVRKVENAELAERLRSAFSAWYQNGHVNEKDENTVILKITLTDGVLMAEGKRYEF